MTRALRIAAREYVAFVRTVGFWLSICPQMPLGLVGVMFFSGIAAHSAPTPKLAILDYTGADYGAALARVAHEGRTPTAIVVAPPPIADPATASARIRPYLSGEQTTPAGDRLDAVAIVRGTAEKPSLDLWTRNINEPGLQATMSAALSDASRRNELAREGLSKTQIAALDANEPAVTQFSPRSEAGKVSMQDRLPSIAGFGMGIVLWSLILTGAGILLNSVIEEKQNRILEVLLTSASAPEIMTGKILGAAAVTATALMVWVTIATTLFGSQHPEIIAAVAALLFGKGLALFFLIYFVGGYLMYAALFTSIGAFCESPREAQTLLGPMMRSPADHPAGVHGPGGDPAGRAAAAGALVGSALHALPDGSQSRQRSAAVAGDRHRRADVRHHGAGVVGRRPRVPHRGALQRPVRLQAAAGGGRRSRRAGVILVLLPLAGEGKKDHT